MDNNNPIIENIANPRELERIFRRDPEDFRNSFLSAWEQNPNSQVLAVWHERLYFGEKEKTTKVTLLQKDFISMGVLAILAGVSTRVILHFVEGQSMAPINLIFGVIPFISAYFVYNNIPKKNVLFIITSLFLMSAIYLNILPQEHKDSIILAYLHLPVFLWVLLGLAFTGNEYRESSARLAYLKFNGEFCILYATMAISGMLLATLTVQLFSFIGMNTEDFYFKNVVIFGAASLTVVTAYLVTRNLQLAKNIAPYIAKIFSPLALATLLTYLVMIILTKKNPFMDRNFLISFNGVLLGVLTITLFSITESSSGKKRNISGYINFALIVVALIIDSVALSAIMFRLSSYGITPNRLAVLGINILIFINLFWVMFSYMFFFQNKTEFSTVQAPITKYLPIYGLWAAFVTFVFPLIFR